MVIYLGGCLLLWRYQTRLIFFPVMAVNQTPASYGLLYEDVWLPMKTGEVHGWWLPTVYDRTSVPAPVLLYLHGNGSNVGDLIERAWQLHHMGYGLLMIDYRGYGQSSGPFPNEQRAYEDAEAAWRYLTEERAIAPGRIVLYGRSLGGAVALQLASVHPEAAGALIEASFTSMKEMVKHKFPLLLVPTDWLLNQRFESVEKVRSLTMPITFFHGTHDRVVPPYMSQRLYDAAQASGVENKELFWVEGAGHSDLPYVAGDLYAQSISDFVGRYAK